MNLVNPGDEVTIQRTLQDGEGNASDADSLPTGVLVRNGVTTDVTVTIANIETGVYSLSWTVPAYYDDGDDISIRWTATVAGITGKATTWEAIVREHTILSDISDWESQVGESYVSVIDADQYFAQRLWTEAWDEAEAGTKLKALLMATARIDNLSFHGEKTDEEQTLEFPRNDGEEIPTAIRKACCLIALALLDGKNPEEEYNTLRTKIGKFGPTHLEQDTTQIPAHIANGIPSVEAWHLLMPYLRDNRSIILSRVG